MSALGRGFRGLAHKSGRTAYGDEPFYASSSLTEPYLGAKYQLDRRVAPGDVPSLVIMLLRFGCFFFLFFFRLGTNVFSTEESKTEGK